MDGDRSIAPQLAATRSDLLRARHVPGEIYASPEIYRRELVEEGYTFPRRYNLAGAEIGPYGQSAARSAFIYDGDWWKLREITARYALPASVTQALRVNSGSVFGAVRNVYVSSKSPLVDPELAGLVGGGLDLGSETSVTISPPRSFRIGFEFVF